jgi:hypothetical protein
VRRIDSLTLVPNFFGRRENHNNNNKKIKDSSWG